MKITPFEEKYRQNFIDFHTDWIMNMSEAILPLSTEKKYLIIKT